MSNSNDQKSGPAIFPTELAFLPVSLLPVTGFVAMLIGLVLKRVGFTSGKDTFKESSALTVKKKKERDKPSVH